MSVRKSITLLTLTAVALTVASPQAAAAQQTAPASAPAVFDVADRAAIFVAHGVEVAGWGLHPLESAAFSRRTQRAVIHGPRGERVKSTLCCPPRSTPANGMEARESGLRLKAWRRARGGYSATAARPSRGLARSPRPVASGSSPCSALAHHTRRTEPGGGGSARGAGGAARTRTGRVEDLADRIALCASAYET